jgi:hypothetical protein
MRWFSMFRADEKKGAKPVAVRTTNFLDGRIASDSPRPEVTDLIAAFLPSPVGSTEAALQWA